MLNSPRIPSIEQLRQRPDALELERRFGHAALVDALRAEADAWRAELFGPRRSSDAAISAPEGAASTIRSDDDLATIITGGAAQRLRERLASRLRPVLNATGVIVHTNLGRAPLSASALERVAEVSAGYASLEYDLQAGARGSRDVHAEPLLRQLTGAEAAVVVNNNAAATLLMLAALAAGREVVVSRGELVEIGGGFRVPDILAQSGATLREVGTTNRTRISDYGAAIGPRTALILRVHPSNFRIEGFTEQPSLADLVDLGRQTGIGVVEDLGSGFLLPTHADFEASGAARALADEPSVQASLAAGVDLVGFSGDKLLGGPQAGILVGRADPIGRIRRHPLMRALRCDKMTYAALEATLADYLSGRAATTIPVVRMLALTASAIRARAERVVDALSSSTTVLASLRDGHSTIGGGSAPGSTIPTVLVTLRHQRASAEALASRLRHAPVPIIGRIVDGYVALDLRTVPPEEDDRMIATLVGMA